MCSCGRLTRTVVATRECWNQGHFVYKRACSPIVLLLHFHQRRRLSKTDSINDYNNSSAQYLLFTTPYISPITRCLVTDSPSVIPSAETRANVPFCSTTTCSQGPMISRPQTRSSIWTLSAPMGL